ncbi:MAG TPA: histidine--tRNA ligase [Fimbriimonadales bacterium]|nr:histidine--tRNA ligase [Fimbriimonadales bacterium]
MRFQAPRGTEDVLPGESMRWVRLEDTFRQICALYNYQEIRTPTFEDTALFVRLGESTDIVHKEMYTFLDRGQRSISLKPEGTAPAVRAYLEHSLGSTGQVTKLFYITPIFRYDRPQKGRYRESHQTGVELFGTASPDADVEVIDLTARFYGELGIPQVRVKLNSIGGKDCRARYREALLDFARPALADMPAEFRERCERSPLRILDSKDEELRKRIEGAPQISDFLEEDSRAHFEQVCERLRALNVDIELERRLVRGLDYYTRTVFEVHSKSLGAQSQLCGGGRYDNLVEECGGPPTPAVGVAMGVERALIALNAQGFQEPPMVFAVCLTDRLDDFARIVKSLRDANISLDTDPDRRSAKSQFRQADRSGASLALAIGDQELASGSATLKHLRGGEEISASFDDLAATIRRVIGVETA